jgi:hypothetical protein
VAMSLYIRFQITHLEAMHEADDPILYDLFDAVKLFIKDEMSCADDMFIDFVGHAGNLEAYSTTNIFVSRGTWIVEARHRWKKLVERYLGSSEHADLLVRFDGE